ncbi:hypothetical protein AT261_10165 [Bacillus cereus]|nr:hypothetical protein AT261_10165 [Bacillus cereus]
MPTFMISINDNKILREKTAFCIKIYLKLMDVWCYPKIGAKKIVLLKTVNLQSNIISVSVIKLINKIHNIQIIKL